MPDLYVANCSKQRLDFIYRVPEKEGTRRQMIPPGGQERIYQAGMQPEVLDAIVSQHERYGMVRASEIDRRKPFVGLCYEIDKPIRVEKIMYADEHNAGVLTEISAEARKLSAAALHDAIERGAGQSAQLNSVGFEIVEQNGKTEPGMNEIVSVTRDPSRSANTPRRGRKAG